MPRAFPAATLSPVASRTTAGASGIHAAPYDGAMPLRTRWIRPLTVLAALCFAGAAYAVRAMMDGLIDQFSGAAFSGAIVYTIVVFIRPTISPLLAGGIAIAYCWCTEFAQLTPLPAAISERNWFAGQLLGAQFDLIDVAWYPLGVIPLVVAHRFLRARFATGRASAEPGA